MQSKLNRVIVERDKALNTIMKLEREKAMVIKVKDEENARLRAQIAGLKQDSASSEKPEIEGEQSKARDSSSL